MRSIFVKGAKIRPRPLTAIIMMLALLTLSVAACKKSSGSSPTATFQAFYESLKNKDVEAYKKLVSKDALMMLEGRATNMDRTLEEYIKMEMDKPTLKLPDKLETRNEKIEGEKATLEVENTEGRWNTVPLVKEDGQWKVAVEKL
jgi:Domain of unknown function (DUF4878)